MSKSTRPSLKKYAIYFVLFSSLVILSPFCFSQSGNILIETKQVDAHIKFLSSDALKGRGSFSVDIRMAEDYIAKQFEEAGLKTFPQFPAYRHEFDHLYKSRRNPEAEPKEYRLCNIVGYLEGTDSKLKDEFIVFGAHHDHIGIRGNTEDNIYNGAEDNASGTTGVITLAQYYAKRGDNKRSILFVTFGAEEVGIIGSRHLVEDLPVEKEQIIALINFEMIGKPSNQGVAECYLTGWDRSDLGPILKESLGKDSMVLLDPGPEAAKRLFFYSDNISFARAGMVAHTLAGIQSTNDSLAHHFDDEYETLNVKTMTEIIRGVAKASQTLISGEKTPKILIPVE